MKRSDPESGQAIADEILAYLRRHPNAKDTAEGVLNWWIADGNTPLAVVKKVLADLVAGELMTERTDGGGKSYFSLKKNR